MKQLMMTTAVCMALGTSAFADAHTSGFLDYTMSGNELMASELIGMRVYAAENGVDASVSMTADGEKEWDDIGEINDIVVTKDGKVAAVIVGVGGFLGMGEKDVAVDMSQIAVMREADNADDIFLVIKANKIALEDAPMFEEMNDEAEEMEADAAATMEKANKRPMLVAPTIERDGYMAADPAELTAEMLTGARVYGSNDEDVGEIHSLLLTDAGKIDRAIIDVGGFLGLGEKQVAVTFGELTILREDGGDDVNVYIDATQEALEAQPTYEK